MSKIKIKLSKSEISPVKNGKISAKSLSLTSEESISRYGVGFDVHKNKISVCVAAQLKSGDVIPIKDHVFNANPLGIDELIQFLRKYRPISCYLMECTGIYHLPLIYSLKGAFPELKDRIIAMNPLLLNRRITDLGNKNDKADARSIAMLTFYTALLRPSYVGSPTFVRMRDLVRIYHKSKKQSTKFKNRITRLLHSVNIKDVFDYSKEWSLQLLDLYASKDWTLGEAYDHMLETRRSSGKCYAVIEKQRLDIIPFRDVKLTEGDRFIVLMEMSRLFQEQVVAVSYIRKAEKYILNTPKLVKQYQKLSAIPGMGVISAITILLELGDYTRFKNAKAFAKYCGTSPLIDESGEHKKRGNLNRFSNAHLRNAFSSAARVLVNRCSRDSDLAIYAHKQFRIMKMPFKKAVIKVANKLSKTVYYILLDNVDYDPFIETRKKNTKKYETQIEKKQTLLPSPATRVLRRNINDFIAMNFEYLNSSSRFMLCNGFQKMLKRAKELNSNSSLQVVLKKKYDNL